LAAVSRKKSKLVKSEENVTTLAIRNLLYSVSLKAVLQALDEAGYAGLYDFVYVPRKCKDHKNLGFAFVNFVNADVADQFAADWHRSRWLGVSSARQPLNISAAEVQGREAYEKMATSSKKCQVKNTFLRPAVPSLAPGNLLPCAAKNIEPSIDNVAIRVPSLAPGSLLPRAA
jgi:hypothetical protein